jgi:arylsulfatase
MPRARPTSRLLLLSLALAACREAGPERELLLLVSVDTLRADHLGAHGSELGATPRLDRLAAQSVVFDAAYAPSAHTLPSVSALMTGRQPEEIGAVNNDSVLAAGVPTLAAELRQAGWRTHAVVSNWVLRRSSGLDAGFDVYDDRFPQLEDTRPMPERLAADTTAAALREIEACRAASAAPCFVWVHYQDAHGPYTPPGGLRERFLARERARPDGRRRLPLRRDFLGLGGIPDYQALGGEDEVAFYRAGYAGEVAYLDEQIGALLAGLGPAGERATLVFTADHGESLGEQDYWFAHGEYLSEVLVRVPLWLRVPGVAPGRRRDVATLLDLHATLLRLATGRPPDPGRPGRDLLAAGAAERASPVYLATLGGSNATRFGWIEAGYKYVVTFRDGVWQGQLFRLGDDTLDLAAPAPQIAATQRERLAAFRERMSRPEPVTRPDVDRELLRALGYDASTRERDAEASR